MSEVPLYTPRSRVPGFGFRVSGSRFCVSDFGFSVSGFGYRVQSRSGVAECMDQLKQGCVGDKCRMR